MKPIFSNRMSAKKNGYQSDDDNIRYKLNTEYFNNNKSTSRITKKQQINNDDDNVRYKFPTAIIKSKQTEKKPTSKPKIKVNFWSTKQSVNRLHNNEKMKEKSNRRHTVAIVSEDTSIAKPKNSSVKVCKRVSFLPSPLFSENHKPMATVPDDLTIQLNEEEAIAIGEVAIGEDLNQAFVNSSNSVIEGNSNEPPRKSRSLTTQISPKVVKRKQNSEGLDPRFYGNENELEFFTKYVVQKLRRMETNQRIYSENLINTVLMLGQLGKLNGKSKIAEA